MDLIICHPFLQSTGGGDRVVLELAKRFNPTIYSVVYDRESSFQELKEFDIRILPRSKLEIPFQLIKADPRRYNAVSAGFRYYFSGFKDDYDVICAMGSPSEWIRNRNERVSWYCFSPNREAYDLNAFRMNEMSFKRRVLNHALLTPFKMVESQVVPKLEQICTSSEVVRKRIDEYLGRPDAQVIAPGVDCKRFSNAGYDKYFFYPSRIVPEKRFEIAIEAFREFSDRHDGWKLVIGGFLSSLRRDQEYFKRLKSLSYGLNVEFRLNLTESELKCAYANCYAVLFCAINEDFGLIPLEAMASEKPIISIREGGPMYTIVDTVTGYLVTSSSAMAAWMSELAERPDLVESIGYAGRKHVEQNYTWKGFLDQMEHSFKAI